jgi:hypothetical protein
MYTFQALQIFLFLIPGFISSAILNTLVVRKKEQGELAKIIEALIFSMLIYTFYSFLIKQSPIVLDQTSGTITYSYDAESFLALFLLSVLLPIPLALFATNDWHMKLARWLKISKRTARSSVWFDVFYDVKKHIIVDFENGRQVYGWPMYYSDDPDEPYIYLYEPFWIQDNKYVPTGLTGLLITPEQKIEFIEFLDK